MEHNSCRQENIIKITGEDAKVFHELLLAAMQITPLGADRFAALDEDCLQKIMETSMQDHVDALLWQSVRSLVLPKQLRERWNQMNASSIYREVQYDFMYQDLVKEFDKAHIPFIPLKGLLIKKMYPARGTRFFTDYDLMIRESDVEAADRIMRDKGFRKDESHECNYDIAYLKEPFYNVELHTSLLPDMYDAQEYLQDIWSRATFTGNIGELTPEDFYFFFIAHAYKHYEQSELGIRHFIDCFYVLRDLRDSFGFIPKGESFAEELKRSGMEEFERFFTETTQAFFSGEALSEEGLRIFSHVLGNALFGTEEDWFQRHMDLADKRGGMWKKHYFLSRFFIPIPELKEKYPFVKKSNLLIPLGYCLRFFSVFIKMNNIRNELNYWSSKKK